MSTKIVTSLVGGALLRILLFLSPYRQDITDRVEVSTPVNSMYRVVESIYRMKLKVDPYSSDLMHESPIHLSIYELLITVFDKYLIVFFTVLDLITAVLLYSVAKKYMYDRYVKQYKEKHNYLKEIQGLVLYGLDFGSTPLLVMNMYLFNPYTLFNCISLTTTVPFNFFLAMFFASISYHYHILSLISLVYCTLQSFYPIVFVAPFFLSIKQKRGSIIASFSVLIFIALMAAVLGQCQIIYGSWDFIHHTYGFVWNVRDQQPNVGVYWYFFMEMFEHFRLLFIYSYQMNVTILYLVPLSIKFRKDPILLAYCFAFLVAVFKSYPSIGDFAFTLAMLPTWSYLHNCMQQIFVSGVAIFVTTALSPVLWDLWICWGTANANFYFGTTLGFITAHIFILTDISFAVAKYEHHLKFGNKSVLNGKPAKLVLE